MANDTLLLKLHTDPRIAMTNIPVAMIAADEFETACAFIPELSAFPSYDDWLDYRYGRFMGCSLGGLRAELIPVGLVNFLARREEQ